jgi:hypothetical protein
MEGGAAPRRMTLHEQNGDTIVYELSGHSWPGSLSAGEQAWFAAR